MSTEAHTASDVSISTSSPETLEQDSAVKSSGSAIDGTTSPDLTTKIADVRDGVEGEDEDDEEEGECGFCLFMKGGGCKDTFVAWEECISAVENENEDIAEKCFEATSLLRKCMEANADYYDPIMRAEKQAEQMATIEVEYDVSQIEEKVGKDGGLDSDKVYSANFLEFLCGRPQSTHMSQYQRLTAEPRRKPRPESFIQPCH